MVVVVGGYQLSVTRIEQRPAEPEKSRYLAAEAARRLEQLELTLARERATYLARWATRS